MNKISIDKLYTNYEILIEAEDRIGEYTKEYEEIIAGVKGGEKEKKLASQFIAKFFKYFPSLQFQAIEALFDICEDDDTSIRKQAIKVLPNLCKNTKEHTFKVADVLAQLLQLDDPQEHIITINALIEVIKVDPMDAVRGLLKQIEGSDYMIRVKCVRFLSTKFLSLGPDIITKEVEDYVIAEVKKNILRLSAEEFISLMEFLIASSYGHTTTGQLGIIDIALEQADLDAKFIPLDEDNDNVDRLIVCVNFIMPFLQTRNVSTDFVEYFCVNVLPQFDILKKMDRGEMFQTTLLRQLAELSFHCGKFSYPIRLVSIVLDMLKKYLPLPPANNDLSVFPHLDYSAVECLVYTFHRLVRQCPEFLTSDPEVLRDFRLRLQYFSRGTQGCLRTMKDSDFNIDDQQQINSYRICKNINVLIRDFFYCPPVYKGVITLSWKQNETIKNVTESSNPPLGKRHAPITIDFDQPLSTHKQGRKSIDNVKLYRPPSGKFSSNFQNQNRKPMRGGGGGRGRLGRRGRGRGRGNWRN